MKDRVEARQTLDIRDRRRAVSLLRQREQGSDSEFQCLPDFGQCQLIENPALQSPKSRNVNPCALGHLSIPKGKSRLGLGKDITKLIFERDYLWHRFFPIIRAPRAHTLQNWRRYSEGADFTFASQRVKRCKTRFVPNL